MSEIKQGYKQTKVGIIPEDWEDIKIKDIVKVSQGLQIAIDDRFTTPAHNRVFYITIPFIEGKKEEYIENPKSSTLCKKDDILVVRTGSGVGKIIRGVEGTFHNNFFKVKPSDNINIDFFYYFLTSPRVQFLMAKYAGNSAIPDLNHGDFYSLDFLIPPLKEQQKIAEILTTWDEAITKQAEFIKEKELLKKALMQKLLSGEVRFDGFSDEWVKVRLGEIGDSFNGLSGKTGEDFGIGEAKYITYKNIFDNPKIRLDIFDNVKIADNEKQNLVKFGDIFFTVSSETPEEVGMSSVLLDNVANTYLNSFCFGYRLNSFDTLDPYFARFYFRSFQMRDKISRLAQGSTRFNLSKNGIMKLKLKLPSLPEQQKIAEVLSLIDDEINLLKNELKELKLQKKALMQKLLTGEVRVKV
jgi:type I restriction enzyme S subunit